MRVLKTGKQFTVQLKEGIYLDSLETTNSEELLKRYKTRHLFYSPSKESTSFFWESMVKLKADTVHVDKIDYSFMSRFKYALRSKAVIDKEGRSVLLYLSIDDTSFVLDNQYVSDLATINTHGRSKINKMTLQNGAVMALRAPDLVVDSLIIKQGATVENQAMLNPHYVYVETDQESLNFSWLECPSLSELLVVSSTLKRMGGLKGQKKLKKIVLPQSVEYIGADCFSGCDSLKEIILPSALKELPEGCFCDLKSLERITIPESVEHIGKNCFIGCDSLKEIILPSALKELPEGCFRSLKSLERITIPQSVEYIGYNCFSGCDKLTVTVLRANPPEYSGNNLFSHNNRVLVLPENYEAYRAHKKWAGVIPSGPYKKVKVTTQSAGMILSVLPAEELHSIDSLIVCGPVNEVDISIIRGMGAISYLDLTESKPALSENALQRIKESYETNNMILSLISASNAVPSDKNWVMTEEEYNRRVIASELADALVIDSPEKQVESFLKSGVALLTGCFTQMREIQEIRLPNSLKVISEECFKDCNRLKTVVLPKELISIGDHAFDGCQSLENISIPKTVKQIRCEFSSEKIKEIDLSSCSCDGEEIGCWRSCSVDKFLLPKTMKKLYLRNVPRCKCLDIPVSVDEIYGSISDIEVCLSAPIPPRGDYSFENCTITCPPGSLTQYYAKFSKGNKVVERK
jgi:hypothetical protein